MFSTTKGLTDKAVSCFVRSTGQIPVFMTLSLMTVKLIGVGHVAAKNPAHRQFNTFTMKLGFNCLQEQTLVDGVHVCLVSRALSWKINTFRKICSQIPSRNYDSIRREREEGAVLISLLFLNSISTGRPQSNTRAWKKRNMNHVKKSFTYHPYI